MTAVAKLGQYYIGFFDPHPLPPPLPRTFSEREGGAYSVAESGAAANILVMGQLFKENTTNFISFNFFFFYSITPENAIIRMKVQV